MYIPEAWQKRDAAVFQAERLLRETDCTAIIEE